MGISTISDQSKTYSNSPSPLVWMSYGIGSSISTFHKLKMVRIGLVLGFEQSGFGWMLCYGGRTLWKV